jgi:hypothetical protein
MISLIGVFTGVFLKKLQSLELFTRELDMEPL